MPKRHFPRAWEFTRFWQKEQEYGGSRYAVPESEFDLPDIDWPEHLRMPRTRGETNRFRLSLKKSIVQADRGQTISSTYFLARMRRRMNRLEQEMERGDDDDDRARDHDQQ